MPRPRFTARTRVAKLSSVSTIFAACLDTSEPLPMATPMSACLSAAASLTAAPVIPPPRRAAAHGAANVGRLARGRVVAALAVHPDPLAVLLHELAQPKLVLGGHPP